MAHGDKVYLEDIDGLDGATPSLSQSVTRSAVAPDRRMPPIRI